jgi:DNA-binding FadR family transcriptional regulator
MATQNRLFRPLKVTRSFERVSAHIKKLIFDGVLKPGDKLPPEVELAHQFGVSRQTIREALRILELSGFITVQKGGSGGPLIQNTILHTINALFLDAFQMEKISNQELTSARRDIEKVVLARVVEKADGADFDRLRDNIHRAKNKLENNLLATDDNIQFHNLLAEAAKNHVYVIVMGSIMAVERELMSRHSPEDDASMSSFQYTEGVLKSRHALEYHEGILNALVERDLPRAVILMDAHLQEVEKRVQMFLK